MERTIPRGDVDFNERQNIISTAAATNATAWGLDTDWLTNVFGAAKAKWVAAWAAYTDPMTRTRILTMEKTGARKAYEPLLRILVGNLEYNTRMSDDERIALGIAARSGSHSPVRVPATYPDATVDCGTIRRLTVHFHDHGSVSRGKPHGVRSAVIRYAVLDAVPEGVEALTGLVIDSASPCTLEFSNAQRGKTAWLCLAWQNTRGERGPWGEIISAIVP